MCDASAANIHASRGVAIREFPLPGHGFADGNEARAAGHGRPVSGFADYLLYVDGKAAGVIEAKKEGATLSGVETQSAKYTQGLPKGLPRWANPLPFSYQSTGTETRFTNDLDPAPRSRPVFSFHKPETSAAWLEDARITPSPLARDKHVIPSPSTGEGEGGGEYLKAAEAASDYRGRGQTFLARLQHMPALKEAGLWPAQIKAIHNLEQSLKENRPRALIQMGERRVKEPRTPAQGRSGVVVSIRWMLTPLNGQTGEGLPWACEWRRMRNDASAGRTTSKAGLRSEVTGSVISMVKIAVPLIVQSHETLAA